MVTDPIANFLCQINNAIRVKKRSISLYSSKMIRSILEIMRAEGYIVDFIIKKTDNNISLVTVYLKYKEGNSAIRGVRRMSKPGYRIYCKAETLPIVMSGIGTAIISTNRGVMCEKECRKLNLGGEVIAYIY